MRRVLLITILVISAIALGFFQEQLKISINYILENAPNIPGFYGLDEQQKHQAIESRRLVAPFDYYHSHETLRVLYKFDEPGLFRLKWIVTLCSLVVFFLANVFLLNLLEGGDPLWKRMALIYVGFTLIALGIFMVGKWINYPEQTYAISRRIIGALQSLVPCMIIWPFLRIQKKSLSR